ncbi:MULTISPECIES: formate/nitrite transporter family protein [unclassified Selenomonas]|uniref:formate/nitrite transporter family protein n=1 Tax=unclassified Selenomonas TaxID=2637378 RepID=UPI000497B64C|nr:Formate/nitrite transporter FocA, FNT family [Selenomonas ruminantium]
MEKKDFVSELPRNEQVVLHEHAPLPPRLIYNIIREEGEAELARPLQALAFSGLAAGILVSFSFLFRSIFHMHMGASPMEPLVSCLGYTVGFIIVILGRMQLFTENPITTIIPLLSEWSWTRFGEVVRLWATVFFFNIVGTAIAAAFYSSPYTLSPEIEAAMHDVAVNVMKLNPIENILRGIPAGILIAAIVWISPQTKYFRFVMIMFLVYFIALGDFAHVVVGSCEMAYVVMAEEAEFFDYLFRFLIPCGFGNIIGGTGIFTLLVYYQVAKELKVEKKRRTRK